MNTQNGFNAYSLTKALFALQEWETVIDGKILVYAQNDDPEYWEEYIKIPQSLIYSSYDEYGEDEDYLKTPLNEEKINLILMENGFEESQKAIDEKRLHNIEIREYYEAYEKAYDILKNGEYSHIWEAIQEKWNNRIGKVLFGEYEEILSRFPGRDEGEHDISYRGIPGTEYTVTSEIAEEKTISDFKKWVSHKTLIEVVAKLLPNNSYAQKQVK